METTMVYVYKPSMNVHMNYYIEKHDMEIILDALENLVQDMKHSRDNGHYRLLDYPYSIDEVNNLFQSFDNNFKEDHK